MGVDCRRYCLMKNIKKLARKVPPEAADLDFPKEERKCYRSIRRILVLSLIALFLSCVGTMGIAEIWPYFGAQVADQVREVFGARVVAGLETIVFQIQDTLKGWWYQLSPKEPESPWKSTEVQLEAAPFSLVMNVEASLTPLPTKCLSSPTAIPIFPSGSTAQTALTGFQHQVTTSSPTPTQSPYHWQLSNLVPYGSLDGEGVWQPYLYDLEGHLVAQRTFLQPDPERPYTVVAVVAFDLNRTRLHFVLGFNEPSTPDGPRGEGLVPGVNRQPGILLAAFNGGFRAANGHFGAMADGIIALPPKDDFATIAIYQNGEVRIGNWGEEISESPNLLAWRQNCRLVVQDGAISTRVYSNSVTDWGASISNQIVTRRSGLGLNQTGEVLYYFAGSSLSMPILADTMLAVGVHDGMLLDINHFWVHFTAIRDIEGELVAEPLLPDDMIDHIDRYLNPSPVDFFYITALENQQP